MLGQYVIVRSGPSGCWGGTFTALDGSTVTLTNARRLWRWWSAEGVSLSGVAAKGLHPDMLTRCRIAVPVETAIIFDVCEILKASSIAEKSISEAPSAVDN